MTAAKHAFSVDLECRYLLEVPSGFAACDLLVLVLHGYGQNPEIMLRLVRGMIGPRHAVASLQAPNRFYLSPGTPESAIGYNWGTRDDWPAVVRLHHRMVIEASRQCRDRLGFPSGRVVLAGFSQPVGLNYRFAATHPAEIGGVVGICGGVPKDWEDGAYQRIEAAILHIAREEDEFYPAEVSRRFPDRLRRCAADVEFHLLPGSHRFPSKAGPIFSAWAARVFGTSRGVTTG